MAKRRSGDSRKERRSYAWALAFPDRHPLVRELSWRARSGLGYARDLGEDAEERREAPLRGETLSEPPLTVAQLARWEGLSPIEIYSRIKQARIELFGKDLSDRAIRYRLKRARELGDPSRRRCQEAGCERGLPRHATARRRYCEFHLASHSRVRRHRRRAKERSKPSRSRSSGVRVAPS